MKPLDPRLLRHAAAARTFLVLAVLLGLLQILLVLAFAWLLAAVLTTVIGQVTGPPVSDFPVPAVPALPRLSGQTLDEVPWMSACLVGVVVLRAVVAWVMETVSARAAVTVKSQLRSRTAQAFAADPSRTGGGGAHAVTVLGPGLDALDAYFSRYLPHLVLTVLAIPVHLAVLALYDMTTAVIVALTMPLIPVFMVLIGWSTQTAQQRQWDRLNRLARAYLDIVEGLSTLKIFNRQDHQRGNLVRITEAHRRSTMKVLRVSFLSGFVLELAASLSVALVAVSIGVRLVDGSLGLFVGLFALLIVPEAFAPLRQVGVNYHAAADGVAAAEDVFEVLDGAREPPNRRRRDGQAPQQPTAMPSVAAEAGLPEVQGLSVSGVTVRRGPHTVLDDFTAEIPAGRIAVLTGPSGAGKSTLFAALMGMVPASGKAVLRTRSAPGSLPLTREHIAWSGQRSGLRAGTVSENLSLGTESPDEELARILLDRLGLDDISLGAELGVRGQGVSGGQAHRLSVARALYRARARNCPVLLLDEPSAALDACAEAALINLLREEAEAGRAVLVISHRPAVEASADVVLRLDGAYAGKESPHARL